MKPSPWDNSLITRDQAAEYYSYVEALSEWSLPYQLSCSGIIASTIKAQAGITQHSPNVFTVPWLTPDYCARIIDRYRHLTYTPNDEEPEDAQIPEIVLYTKDKPMAYELEALYDATLSPLVQLLTGCEIEDVASIQLARYEPNRTYQGCYHLDQDSDITVTVALNDDYEGGGLSVCEGHGILSPAPVMVPKLSVGTASVFKGKSMLHMGQPVTKGTKHLLVFWMKT